MSGPDITQRVASVPIAARAAQVGGAVGLLHPTLDTPFGPLEVPIAIKDKWGALISEHEAGGQNVQAYLGWPLRRLDFGAFGGGTAVYFEHGMIVLRSNGGCFAVYGAIYLAYAGMGDVQPTGWSPGLPTSDEQAVTNGRRSTFDGADIYWSGASGAHEVHGAIRDHWQALGGVDGFLGYPLTDETSVQNAGAEIGRMNLFQGGSIYWSPGSGAWEVHGDLRRAWLERFGGPTGSLGWPVSDESSSPSNGLRYNDFQNGCLVWPGNYDGIRTLTSFDVYIDRFDSFGSHTTAEDLGIAGIWLYVNASVSVSNGQNVHPRFPNQDHYGSNATPQVSMLTVNPVRGSMTVDVSFDGWDAVAIGSDHHLGTVTGHFDLDSIFNNPGPQDVRNGDFEAVYSLRNLDAADPADPSFRQDLFWGFRNFSTAELSRQQFGQTFTDVQGDESGWHPFDDLFYDNVYKGIAANGNCFGMCLEANDALARKSLYSESIHGVGDSPTSRNEMNLKQGYQVGADVIDYLVGKFLTGGTHDPVRCFNESRDMYGRNDFPIISITNKSLGGSGHAVRPYRWDQSNPNDWVIFVANPNEPAPGGSDGDGQNTIHIDPNANRFTFAFSGGDVWTGDGSSGGRMFAMPFSVMCHEQRTPFWETLLALIGGSILLLAGDAQTQQIADDQGRTFYAAAVGVTPTTWDEVNENQATRIPGMARVPFLHQQKFRHLDPNLVQKAAEGASGSSPAGGLEGPIVSVDPSQLGTVIRALPAPTPELYRLQGSRPFGLSPAESTHFGQLGTAVGLGTALQASTGTAIGVTQVPATSPAAGALSTVVPEKQIPIQALQQAGSTIAINPVLAASGPVEQLVHTVSPGSGSYTWATHSAGGSVAATIPGGAAAADSIAVNKPGAAEQAVAITLGASAQPRTVDLTLVSSTTAGLDQLRTYRLSKVALEAGQAFTAGLSTDGSQIVLQNAGQPVTLQLEIQAGLGPQALVSRPAVTLEAGKTAVIQPTTWDPAQIATSPVTMSVMDKVGGPVLQEVQL